MHVRLKVLDDGRATSSNLAWRFKRIIPGPTWGLVDCPFEPFVVCGLGYGVGVSPSTVRSKSVAKTATTQESNVKLTPLYLFAVGRE